MACGKSVIASQAGGAAELFADNENALGHPSGNAAALGQQILRLVRDAALRQRLGKAGRASAEQLYQGQRLAKELLALYREISSRAAGREPGTAIQPPVPAIR